MHRPGLYQCNACREPFTVTVGTLYERSHIALNKWLAATHLLIASKKGMSALQIGLMPGLPYKTAWFMCHRIRELLRETMPEAGPLSGKNKLFEAYIGGKETNNTRRSANPRNKEAGAKSLSSHWWRAAVRSAPVTSPTSAPGRSAMRWSLTLTAHPTS